MSPDTRILVIEAAPLFVNEKECARRLGWSDETWRRLRPKYTRIGLPPIDPICRERYWPAVRAFFDRINGLGGHDGYGASQDPGHWEDFEDLEALSSRRGTRKSKT